MEVVVDSEGGKLNGGLQMLLDRWRLQERKLQDFEESLKEVNNLMTYQRVQENLGGITPEISLTSCNNDFDTSVCDKNNNCMSCVSSSTPSEHNVDHNPYKGIYMEENMDLPIATNDESMEEFEKRIWGGLWKAEAYLDDTTKESSDFMLEGVRNSLKYDSKFISNEMTQLPNIFLINDLKSDGNVIRKDINSHGTLQNDFQRSNVQGSISISHDNSLKANIKDGQSSSIYSSLEGFETSHKFEKFHQHKKIDSTNSNSLFKCNKLQFRCKEINLIGMTIDSMNFEPSTSFTCNEEFDNTYILSKQRATFAKNIMAAEVQRQMEREKEKELKFKALKLEEVVVANMEKHLKVSVFINKEKNAIN
jgi:hypothetical protein